MLAFCYILFFLLGGLDYGHLTHIGCQFRVKFRAESAPLPRISYYKGIFYILFFFQTKDTWGGAYHLFVFAIFASFLGGFRGVYGKIKVAYPTLMDGLKRSVSIIADEVHLPTKETILGSGA